MFRLACPKCRRTGLVRGERIIKASEAATELTCNGCGHVWREPDRPEGRQHADSRDQRKKR